MADAVFVVDTRHADIRDVTTDGHNYQKHSCPRKPFWVVWDKNEISSISTDSVKGSDEYLLYRHYSWKKGITRTILKVKNDGQLRPYVIIQYKVEGTLLAISESEKGKYNYIRTKPSVLEKMRSLAHEAPKDIISKIAEENGGAVNARSVNEVPQDRRQVYNALARSDVQRFKTRNTGPRKVPEFGKLITSMSQGSFIKDMSFSVKESDSRAYPTTFGLTRNGVRWMQNFCSGKGPVAQVYIDMTYNVGPYYVTCMTFANPLFVYKTKPPCQCKNIVSAFGP